MFDFNNIDGNSKNIFTNPVKNESAHSTGYVEVANQSLKGVKKSFSGNTSKSFTERFSKNTTGIELKSGINQVAAAGLIVLGIILLPILNIIEKVIIAVAKPLYRLGVLLKDLFLTVKHLFTADNKLTRLRYNLALLGLNMLSTLGAVVQAVLLIAEAVLYNVPFVNTYISLGIKKSDSMIDHHIHDRPKAKLAISFGYEKESTEMAEKDKKSFNIEEVSEDDF